MGPDRKMALMLLMRQLHAAAVVLNGKRISAKCLIVQYIVIDSEIAFNIHRNRQGEIFF